VVFQELLVHKDRKVNEVVLHLVSMVIVACLVPLVVLDYLVNKECQVNQVQLVNVVYLVIWAVLV